MVNKRDYVRVKDIMTVPASKRINGKKAISVHENWAYVQHPDGMTIYRYISQLEEWQLHKTIIATNI